MLGLFRNTARVVSQRRNLLRFASDEVVVSFKDVSFEYIDNKPLLKGSNFKIRKGNKVTIMGQNGSGKSTIIKLMSGSLQANSGNINIERNSVVATALQIMPRDYRDLTVLEFFTKQLHGVTSGISSRIAASLVTVGLEAPYERTIKTFSGGQQARLLLASALALEPDILLLDEPTNNLDVAGIDFLTSFIQMTDKTCVVISHDEDFLNSFSDSVLYLDSHTQKVEQYEGDYKTVKREIAARIQKENADNARLLKDAQAKKAQAGKFANKGGNLRAVALKMREEAAKFEAAVVDVRVEDKALKKFEIPYHQVQGEGGSNLMVIPNFIKPGENTSIPLRSGPITMYQGLRVRVRGPNGIGKTTLLEAIAHKRLPGIEVSKRVTIGYYRQDFDNLDFDMTVMKCLEKAAEYGDYTEQEIRKIASKFFIQGPQVKQKIATLSEGQKGLLSLTCLVLQRPGILIMDEPTNHINFRHLPALANALNTFEGALLLVSHDNDFVKKIKIHQEIDLEFELNGV